MIVRATPWGLLAFTVPSMIGWEMPAALTFSWKPNDGNRLDRVSGTGFIFAEGWERLVRHSRANVTIGEGGTEEGCC